MITRSRRDSNYKFLELPDKKRCKKQETSPIHDAPQPSPSAQPTQPTSIPIPNDYIESEISIYNIPYRPLYEVNIDFDEAHNEWVKNKIKMPNGCYKYRKERATKTRTKKTM